MDVNAVTLDFDHEAVARNGGIAVSNYLDVFFVLGCDKLLPLAAAFSRWVIPRAASVIRLLCRKLRQ